MAERYTSPMVDDPPDRTDVVLLAGPTEDGEGIRVLRARDERIETGEVRPLKEGKPLGAGEIVKLAPRPGTPRICDVVEVIAKLEPAGERGSGPPKVATNAYRESWDRIFGGAPDPRTLN